MQGPGIFNARSHVDHGKLVPFPGKSRNGRTVESLMRGVIEHSDDCAFKELFDRMYSPLCQFCLRFVQIREVAEELVSDVFCTLWYKRNCMTVASHRAYLFNAVRNRCIDHIRRAKRTVWYDLEAASHLAVDQPDGNQVLAGLELDRTIRESVAALPRQCRVIFELSREEGLKYREIAAHLNISVKTVETQMGRALKHLHEKLNAI